MEKQNRRVQYLVFLWIVYVALDGICTLFRSCYGRKMGSALSSVFRGTTLIRSLVVFLIAIFNYLLISKRS